MVNDRRIPAESGGIEALPASFAIRFSPSSHLISIVRRFVHSFYGKVLDDAELASQLALATHELLENAVKYGTTNEAGLAVTVAELDDGFSITVAIRNRAEEEDIAEARRLIDALAGAADPFAYYQELMHEAAERVDGSGLGIARIAAETGMTLEAAIVDDELEIRARTTFKPRRST